MNRKALGLVALGAALAAMELGKEYVKHKEFKCLENKVNRLGNCYNGFVEHVMEQEDETNACFEQLEEKVGTCHKRRPTPRAIAQPQAKKHPRPRKAWPVSPPRLEVP